MYLHGEDLLLIAVSEMAPPLAFVWKDHGILQGLDHGEPFDRDEVVLVSLVDSHAFVVPLSNLGVGLIRRSVHTERIAEVVSLEKRFLGDRFICCITAHVRKFLANRAEKSIRIAVRKASNTRHCSVHAQEVCHRRVVVLVDITTAEAIALTEARTIDERCVSQLGILPNVCGEDVDIPVHCHNETIRGVCDLVLAGRNADAVVTDRSANERSNRLHAIVEARISHAMGDDGRISCRRQLDEAESKKKGHGIKGQGCRIVGRLSSWVRSGAGSGVPSVEKNNSAKVLSCARAGAPVARC
jgi:hypothetical protein